MAEERNERQPEQEPNASVPPSNGQAPQPNRYNAPPPPYGMYPQTPPKDPMRGYAITAFCLSLGCLLMTFFGCCGMGVVAMVLGIPMGGLAITFGVLYERSKETQNRSLARVGWICGIVALILVVFIGMASIALADRFSEQFLSSQQQQQQSSDANGAGTTGI